MFLYAPARAGRGTGQAGDLANQKLGVSRARSREQDITRQPHCEAAKCLGLRSTKLASSITLMAGTGKRKENI